MNHSVLIPGICIILLSVFCDACKVEEKDDGALPVVITYDADHVGRTSANCGGYVISVGSPPVTAFGICWDTTGSPTLDNSFTADGEVPYPYLTTLHGLKPNTTYYFSAYASNHSGTGYGDEKIFTTRPAPETITFNDELTYDSISDIDGNVYKTIEIGTQTWMAENLRTTRYNDNTEIPLITDKDEWGQLVSPGYCWYENNRQIFETYGAYYNWYTVYTGKLCPSGWHVPSDEEWKTLEMVLGMSRAEADDTDWRGTNEGLKIKETGSNNWYAVYNINGTNESGFTGLPGGYCWEPFDNEGYNGYWWTFTAYSPYGGVGYCRSISYSAMGINRFLTSLSSGLNVRCIKD